MGALGAVGGVATAVGPAVGGALIDNLTWRWAFFLNVPLGIIVFALVAPRLPSTFVPDPSRRRPPDLAGGVLLMAGVAALAVGLEGQSAGHGGVVVAGPDAGDRASA